ncbi:MAG: arginine deiminase-related protein [Steroidobacteraceae bacterium]
MVRPARFGCNPQTATSNAFQANPTALAGKDLQGAALREFHGLAEGLERAGVEVLIAHDSEQPAKPDAIFPNNWVSFHHDGTVALYPMLAPNRRCERRDEVLERVVRQGGFRVSRTVDLTHRESENKYLEGTGSVVLDRVHRIAYACSSPRTDLDVLGEFAQQLDYELMTFDAVDAGGAAIYHTNVLMAIGAGFAVVCSESIPSSAHRAAVLSKLRSTGHEIVEVSLAQMARFAANVLELTTPKGNLIALSSTALSCLAPDQRRVLESRASLIPAEIPTIERIGGGGVRCMLAEIHLPKRDAARGTLRQAPGS